MYVVKCYIFLFIQISACLTVIYGLPQYDFPRKRPSGGGRPNNKYLPSGRPGVGGDSFAGGDEEPIIQKHVYLHVPPPELEEPPAPPRAIVTGKKEKHYKIIFVKAPVPAPPQAPIIPPSPGREEKTIVYVLVKKPDEGQDIVIPTQPPAEPVKPEVYFIRYKSSKKEGEEGEEDGVGYSDVRPSFGGISPEYLPPSNTY